MIVQNSYDTLHNLEKVNRAPGPFDAARDFDRALKVYQGELSPECYDDWILPEHESFVPSEGRDNS